MALKTQSDLGDAARGVGVKFREFFSQNVDTLRSSWEPVVRNTTSDGAQETYSGKTGIGTLTRFTDGTAVPKANRFKLFDTAFINQPYGKQIEVTRMMLMNRDFNEAFDEFKDLTIGSQATRSKAPAQIFNGGFANSGIFDLNGIRVVTYADGKNLFSTAHPRVDGGTAQSNASSTSIPLTENNLETERVALIEQLQDDGNPITINGPVYLIVPTALEKTAVIITQSTKRSGTANNDLNFYNDGTYPVMASHWLGATNSGSDTAWYLVAPSISKLILQLRNDLQLDQNIDKNTKSVLFDVIMDFAVGSYDWHATRGSQGDNSSYSS